MNGRQCYVDDTLLCYHELANVHNPFAVKVIKAKSIVGHLPKKISSTCFLFIMEGGVILCKVTAPDKNTQEIWLKVALKYLV